jgi:hypothetical protein
VKSPKTLIVEGAEADDVAGFICRHACRPGQPAMQEGCAQAGEALPPPIEKRHIVLISADGDWLQFLEHPNIHCLDPLGSVHRPEWHQTMLGASMPSELNIGSLDKRKRAFQRISQAVNATIAQVVISTEDQGAQAASVHDARLWLCQVAAAGATWKALLVRTGI